MKIYVVGGAIRDKLLGLPESDRDYVVVGSTPEQMRALGFIPVGQDFPVFLHPITKQEYALARTERKSGQGYLGFTFHTSPDVSLEQDLIRRDFTINAMAQEVTDSGELIGPIIDPYGGQADLAKQVFRHVSDAFMEDPLRILRLARFLARFVNFTVEPYTQAFVVKMVEQGELNHLVAQRVWQEMSRGLLERQPSRMLAFLSWIGAATQFLPSHLKEPQSLKAVSREIDQLAKLSAPLEFILATLLSSSQLQELLTWLEQHTVPTDLKQFSKSFKYLRDFLNSPSQEASPYLTLFHQVDLWRKPERFHQLLKLAQQLNYSITMLEQMVGQLALINAGAIAQQSPSKNGEEIARAVDTARLTVIASCL